MLAVGIRYLNGFVAAGQAHHRDAPEWPPHPARVFMAMAAACLETGGAEEERKALLWLESAGEENELFAPAIAAGDSWQRSTTTRFVPVNNSAGPSKALLQSAPVTRDRQARTFAQAWLENDTVYLTWPSAEPDQRTRAALEALCAKVTRIGHSSSLVQMWLADAAEAGEPRWVPNEDEAAIRLRVAAPGTLEYLEWRYNGQQTDDYCDLAVAASDDSKPKEQKAAKKLLRAKFPNGAPSRLRPELSVYQGYASADAAVEPEAVGTVFSPNLIVVRLERKEGPYRALDLSSSLALTGRWRDAVLSRSNDLSQETRNMISGHRADGTPLEGPHVAFAPLAFVDHPHADGHLLGMGFALPERLSREDRREVLRAFGRVKELFLGPLGVWTVEGSAESRPSRNLRAETWTAHPHGALRWATVTPIAFDEHPKARDRAGYLSEAAAMIKRCCVRVGLPEPRDVLVTAVSGHLGTPPAHEYPRMGRKSGGLRRHSHAILTFEQPVRGPILLGAGRYRGYGLCRPLE